MWDPHVLARLLVCGFFAVLFLQSGFDKAFDWKGNLAYLSEHFSNSPFARLVPLLLLTITTFEVITGIASGAAAVLLYMGIETLMPVYALGFAGLTLTMLFAGQRIAKDYAGAATLAIYFGVALLGLYITRAPA